MGVGFLEKKNILRQIFKDHWKSFLMKHMGRIRHVVNREVNRMIGCGDEMKGYTKYCCEACGESKKVAFTCKSRFCHSCGKIYTDNWIEDFTNRMINAPHKHLVFTIPEALREVFLKERKLLEVMTISAADTIKGWCIAGNKKEKRVPGMVCVIHTFGRDLKWNPHVHMMMTMGAIGESGLWKKIDFIPYEMLRKRWETTLLVNLEKRLGKTKFRELKNKMYKDYTKGFYVYAKGQMKDARGAARYVGRYMSRPAIAESRIQGYDGQMVTFWYERHEDGKRVEETITAEEFIAKLIRHIPDKNFKMVRNYGLYSRNNKHKKLFIKRVDEYKVKALKKLRNWRFRLIQAYKYDPLSCPKCGETMKWEGIYHGDGTSLSRNGYNHRKNQNGVWNYELEKKDRERKAS